MLTLENKNNIDFEETHIFKKLFNNSNIIEILSHYSENNIRNKVNSFIIFKTEFGNTIIIPETEDGRVVFKDCREIYKPHHAGLIMTMHISAAYAIEMSKLFRDAVCENVIDLFKDYQLELIKLASEAELESAMLKLKIKLPKDKNAIN